jgi:spermidine/putrescine transport system ATP-binding protein
MTSRKDHKEIRVTMENTNNSLKVQLIDVVKEFSAQRADAEALRAVNDVSLNIRDGEFFAMLGPSGCGKTTTLRLIAGFEQPTSGQILIDGRPMQGIPSFHRPVNTVFQDYALFPHMSVLKNVMFGLEMEKVPKKEAQERALEALEDVRLPQAASRRPRELSGGMQQRVALARALVKKPSVLLLDEPLGALDLKLRREMQLELKTMHQELGLTFIFVTHDQEEAMTMADRIAVMNEGKVLQVGTPEEIYETPATRFVADFIGETNFIPGTLTGTQGDIAHVQLYNGSTAEGVYSSNTKTALSQEVVVTVRPERVTVSPETPSADTALNQLIGHIMQSYYIGTDVRYLINVGNGYQISARVQNTGNGSNPRLEIGQPVKVTWNWQNARILAE